MSSKLLDLHESKLKQYISESISKMESVEASVSKLPFKSIMSRVAANYYLKEFLNNTKGILYHCDKEQARNVILFARKMWNKANAILEADGGKVQPVYNDNTGINVLEELLKKIIPVLEKDYKMLTTDQAQRTSFRTHIINAVQNIIASENLMLGASTQEKGFADRLAEAFLNEQEAAAIQDTADDTTEDPNASQGNIDATTTDTDREKFIDVFNQGSRTDVQQKNEKEEVEYSIFSIEGNDETGRNVAFKTFKKVQSQVTELYKLLANEEDKDMFRDYLIANLKLYFDKFEEEINVSLPEPTNSEYEENSLNGINAAETTEEQGIGSSAPSSETSLPPI